MVLAQPPNSRVHDVLTRLEAEAQIFRVPEGTAGYEGVWTPNGFNEYWQIPRTTAELLYALANAHRAKAILELGTSAGYSALWLAMAARQHQGRVTTVEMAAAKAAMATRNIEEAGLSDIVKIVNQPAARFLASLSGSNKQFDLLFLDADKSNYLAYFRLVEPQLLPGALILADNAVDYREHMIDFVEYLDQSSQYTGMLLHVDNGLLIYSRTIPPLG